MSDGPGPAVGVPSFEALTEDLRLLRKHGLVELRRLPLAALGGGPAQIEALMRAAIASFGPGTLTTAAEYTFGLAQGTRDWPAQDRRRRAAEVYGLSVERFRKQQERIIIEQVAERIVALLAESADTTNAADLEDATAATATSPDVTGLEGTSLGSVGAQGASLDSEAKLPSAGRSCTTGAGSSASTAADPQEQTVDTPWTGDEIAFAFHVGAQTAPVVVHVLPIELVRGVDVLVGTSNVYFEISRVFSDTVSAGLRRAAARSDAAGRITDDVVQRELAAWVVSRGGPGTAVPPGTVAVTSPGALADLGVRRLYHAAVAVPTSAGRQYTVDESVIARAVRGIFATAANERDRFDPPLSSLCFPLIGAGRGGLDPGLSTRIMWLAIAEELRRDPSWSVHFAVRKPALAASVIEHLRSKDPALA